jgi:sulfite exporter TauE/SafE
MCGGLVTASCHGGKDVLKYQVGRLLGYSIMGSIAYSLGYVVKGIVSFTWAPIISGLFLGIMFIYWGLQSFNGKKAEVPVPGFLKKSYQYIWRNFVTRAGKYRSFVVGLISILLPCGLIYGLIIAALALGDYQQVMISLLFFWFGTLPAMIGAPALVKKILVPLKRKIPQAYAVIFIMIGVMTIVGRLNHLPQDATADHTKDSTHYCH